VFLFYFVLLSLITRSMVPEVALLGIRSIIVAKATSTHLHHSSPWPDVRKNRDYQSICPQN
jgi:hypothetical protein